MIERLSLEHFYSLQSLQYIFLQCNGISENELRTFDSLTSLQLLFLHNNLLRTLPSNNFSEGEYIAKDMLGGLLTNVRENMGFPPLDKPGSCDESVLRRFQKPSRAGFPLHQFVKNAIGQELKDPDKIILARFMAKFYLLEDMDCELPDNVHMDSVVASLVGHPSMA
ncbi:hypothetical protein NDU88_003796 [Pleurodeles waltl]|uniref:Uncharacterized protein n=1 Tax=Pleurodeles waltl TaxID=8319 RepID=A0AAV7MRM6_PLEWA|nr:hypothetical protein NDU88_003796 [Pleurodeles waltl]